LIDDAEFGLAVAIDIADGGLAAPGLMDRVIDRPLDGAVVFKEVDEVAAVGADENFGVGVCVEVGDGNGAIKESGWSVEFVPVDGTVGAVCGGAGDDFEVAIKVEVGDSRGDMAAEALAFASRSASQPSACSGEDTVAGDEFDCAVAVEVCGDDTAPTAIDDLSRAPFEGAIVFENEDAKEGIDGDQLRTAVGVDVR